MTKTVITQLPSTLIILACLPFAGLPSAEPEQEAGIAAAYQNDVGIEKDEYVIFATSFEDGIQAPLKITRSGVSTVKDTKISFSGDHCAQMTATKNVDEGGDIKLSWKEGVDECYMRVYARFDKDTIMPHHFIYLSAFNKSYKYRWGGAAGILPSGGQDGAIRTTLEPPKGEKNNWKFYSYWHKMHSWQSVDGKADGRPNPYYGNNFDMPNTPSIKRDEWICLEIMLKLNDVGEYNGEQAFWIDGKKIGHWKTGSPEGTWIRDSFRTHGKWNKDPKPFEGFNWRSSKDLQIKHATLQWYLSKNSSWPKMTADKNTIYFDNLVVSKKYIGPMKKK